MTNFNRSIGISDACMETGGAIGVMPSIRGSGTSVRTIAALRQMVQAAWHNSERA
jgi:hypothetical protein